MKIVFTGGGTGGHFYPIISVAQEINKLISENKIMNARLYYLANDPYNQEILSANNIIFKKVPAGKLRRYFSFENFTDLFKTMQGVLVAIWNLFIIYPDVVFGKGGYVSFPVLLAARLLMIPVIIHESDSVPGRTNVWAGKFAKRIAISYPEASRYFPEGKVAYTGNPIRTELVETLRDGAYEFLKLDQNIPVILVVGGSQGSQIINETIFNALPKLVEKYQIIHQTGKNNYAEVKEQTDAILIDNPNRDRYKLFDYLENLGMRMSAGVSSLVISRAGSAIFEIASWGIPSIIIPIADSNGDHQRKNAFSYARSGSCIVIEEANLSASIIISEIARLMENKEEREKMSQSAKKFVKMDASNVIAQEIFNISLKHEI